MIETIAEIEDERLAPYRDIRERDLMGRQDAFMAEGEVVLRLLLARAPHRIRSVLIAEPRLPALRDALMLLPETTPVYVAPLTAMSAVAGFPIHRGVLALGARPPDPGAGALLAALPHRALVLGLIGLANHDNVGGIFRNAAAFGADAVLIDRATCDPLYRKAIRVSVGTALTVPFARAASGEAIVEALAAQGFTIYALSPAGEQPIDALVRPSRAALLLGTEGTGLDPTLMARVETVRIAMPGAIDSLNVATAAAIALHRFATAP